MLLFTKGGKSTDVWFYNVEADGFTLDDKRDPIDENDLPDVSVQWNRWDNGAGNKRFSDRTAKAFYVPKKEIVESNYDLSLNRYQEIVHKEVDYDPPKVILNRLKELEDEITSDLEELEAMLG